MSAFRVSSSACASANILTAPRCPCLAAKSPSFSTRLPLCHPLVLSFLLLLLFPLSPALAQVLPSTYRVLSFVDTFCASPLVPPDRREDDPVMGPLPGDTGAGGTGAGGTGAGGTGAGTGAGGAENAGAGEVGPNCTVSVSTGLLPSRADADANNSDSYNSSQWRLTYVLAVGVVPTDFDWPDQTVQSIRVNGREMLIAGPCRPVGRCGGTRPFACYMGDVSWALPATTRNPATSNSSTAGNPIVNATLTVTVTASAEVAQPCRLCGGFQQLPCQVLQAAVRLTAVLVPVALMQPQPGQPLQEQPPSGAATAVGSTTATGSGAAVGSGAGAGVGEATAAAAIPRASGSSSSSDAGGSDRGGGGTALVALQARLSASSASSVASVAPPASVASAPAVAVSFVRGPGGVSKVGRARFSWQVLETRGALSPARCDACTFLCQVRPPLPSPHLFPIPSSFMSPSSLPSLTHASPPPPVPTFPHSHHRCATQRPLHLCTRPFPHVRHHMLLSFPLSPPSLVPILLSPSPSSSPTSPTHLTSTTLLIFSQPAISFPPRTPHTSPPRSRAPEGGLQHLDSFPTFPCPRRWCTARGLTDGRHLFTVTALNRGRFRDALPSFPCPRGWFTARGLTDGRHRFTVTALKGAPGVTGSRLQAAAAAVGMDGAAGGGGVGGGRGGGGAQVEAQAQATYEWAVDAASPVPTLTVDPPAAREGAVQISVAFDKPCPGLQCNATACDVDASPQGIVTIHPSSFAASLSFLPSLHPPSLPTLPFPCHRSYTSDRGITAGRGFDSYAVIRIDRAPLEATLSCDTPLAVVKFFTQLRATPRVSQSPVTCRVLFSKPVSSFSSTSLALVNATTSDPQPVTDLEYQFQVWPTGEGSVVVDIRHDNVTDAAGNTCQPTQPFFFFFDTTAPTVQLSVSETIATTDWVYPILVAFSEPVLGFNTSSIHLSNGVITCWTGVDRGLGRYYEVTVAAVSDGDVTVAVPAATVVDMAGNPNSPSNTLSLAHYAPGDAGAITAWVVTAVVGWTALSTAAVSLAVTIKESDPTSSPGIRIVSNRPFRAVSTPVVGADPSRNVLRMALHLQVFALTQHLAVRVLPLFYRQLTGGLRWTYFYINAPFKSSFDGWKGVYSSPTDAPGQDNSTAPPSCAPHYLATKADSSASASSSNPSASAQSKLSFWSKFFSPAAARNTAADGTATHSSLKPRNLRRVLASSFHFLLSSLSSPSPSHSHRVPLFNTIHSPRSLRNRFNTADSLSPPAHAHAHMQARQLTTSHVHMRHAMSHPSLSHPSLAHGRSLGSSRALPFHPIPFSPPPTFHLRGLPLTAPSLPSSFPSSFPSSLHSAFPYTLLPSSLSSHPATHYHRMLQETTASTTSNSSASGYSGFNATALIALAVAGGGTGGDAAAAIAAARGLDPTLLPRLSEEEYEYMQAWGDAYYSHFPNLYYSYHGFEQFCAVLFWFALFFFSLSLLQLLFQGAWQHWRYQWLYGLLDPPRLQFLLLALSLAGISWGCTLLIRGSMEPGGTAAGLATGVIVLCLWPVLFLIFSFSVVWYIVVQEQFARFFVREMTEPRNEACIASFARAFWAALRQKRLKGHWVTITPSQKHILPRFGIFFEDFTVWGSVGAWGVLKDRLRAAYGTLDFLKMVLVGALVGAWSPAGNAVAQQACLLTLALLHLLFLLFLQPFTERGLQVVEAVSSGAEVVLFACALAMAIDWDMSSSFAGTLGLVMALAVGLAFIGQLFNHWVALGQQINRMLNPPDDDRSPSHRSDGDDFSDNDDDDLDDDDDDEDFDDEDDGNATNMAAMCCRNTP
ncbi:unnamed protein product [Closterium sp. Naga37s-1]|nr:unnamed protein product [Closterium sp. Naga37s-1]